MTKSQARELIDFTINLALSTPMGKGVTFSKENKETLIAALRGPQWVKTSERLPTEADGRNCQVLTATPITAFKEGWVVYELPWVEAVANGQREYTYWMPMPKLPEVEG